MTMNGSISMQMVMVSYSTSQTHLHLRQAPSFPSCWCPGDKILLSAYCYRIDTRGLTNLALKSIEQKLQIEKIDYLF